MIRNCSKAQALLNAQAVMALAVTFGHGDVVTLSVNGSAVAVTLIFDPSYYKEDWEKEWCFNRMMCGVKYQADYDTIACVYNVRLIWEFNPALP